MKSFKFPRPESLLLALALVALTACSSEPKREAAVDKPVQTPLAATAPVTSAQTNIAQETEAQKFARVVKGVAGQGVYFSFDDFTIKPEYRQLIQANADVLKQTGRSTVVVEGNADERGSREYNLALGQKRAETVAGALKMLGIPADKIEAISFGKEKPRTLCHEEKCWAENRRADFAYKLK